ncbi:MAG: hypothetical protein CSB33_01855 [Desulfobacterales bacterium]|nr:MAG: hypothetical protein CSB33_01855 [Desulfobacterales bacterium]
MIQRDGSGFEKDIGTPDGKGLLSRLYEKADNGSKIEANLSEIKNRIKKIRKQTETTFLKDQRFAAHIRGCFGK